MNLQRRQSLVPLKLKPIEIFTPDNSLKVVGQANANAFGTEIKLLVWNMFKAKKQKWYSDFMRLISGQDLVVLQEAVMNTRHDQFFAQNEMHEWVLGRSFKQKHSGLETGVKTGSITPSIAARSIFSPHREPISRTPKIVLSTRYRLRDTSDQLLVLNVHAINFVSLRKYTQQLSQLRSEIETHHGPIIVAGDFNTWSARRTDLFKGIASEMRLSEAVMEQPGHRQLFPRQLDHVYYRELELKRIKLLRGITSSDHYPISVSFSR